MEHMQQYPPIRFTVNPFIGVELPVELRAHRESNPGDWDDFLRAGNGRRMQDAPDWIKKSFALMEGEGNA